MTDINTLSDRLSTLSDGRISMSRLRDGVLTLVLDVSDLSAEKRDALSAEIEREALTHPDVEQVRIAQTAEKHEPLIIAVASGKGGVGKSTVSTNLAVALSRQGVKVGIVDADIYGPSQPRLLASEGERPQAEEKQLIPIISSIGLPMLSMGHLAKPGQAIAWRGPMAAGALGQLLEAKWRGVDVLVVDMPPGTGDIQLTMIQKHKPAGVVVVSTPQDLALIDAARAVNLFEQAHVPIIGLIENMAGYVCPHCGEISDPFGAGGAESAAGVMKMPFLGRIPLSIAIRIASDSGTPPAAGTSAEAEPFMQIAAQVKAWLNNRTG
ncbi:MAG: chromosome partitioning protein ParA [Sphingobium sp.]|nr:chromosome partitioning protein ParA [Sphingobium sp.]